MNRLLQQANDIVAIAVPYDVKSILFTGKQAVHKQNRLLIRMKIQAEKPLSRLNHFSTQPVHSHRLRHNHLRRPKIMQACKYILYAFFIHGYITSTARIVHLEGRIMTDSDIAALYFYAFADNDLCFFIDIIPGQRCR